MKYRNHILIFFIFLASVSFSQPTFSNIDSLLTKNFRAVSQKDSSYYVSLLNQNEIFKNKNAKTKSDSLVILKPFTDAFFNTIESFKELVLSPDVTVVYSGYECFSKKTDISKAVGKVRLKVDLVLNDSFSIKFVMDVTANHGTYSLDSPLLFMYIGEAE
ncbi:MAG: hypothetical protein K0S26_1661 [Bacteroidota bacterium]|jgi:hypothetical protein|nr:hypothetical protein [Bacteroidota bacterium]